MEEGGESLGGGEGVEGPSPRRVRRGLHLVNQRNPV